MSKSDTHVWVIDGIEEEMARIEEDGERIITVPRYLLPAGAREGQLLRVTRSGGKGRGKEPLTLTVVVDEQATAARLEKSRATTTAAMAASRKRDPGGDVSL
jgi:hypothetical protein